MSTTEPLTLQDLFNNAWRHAVIQKQPPSIDYEGKCMYRGPNGTRCLIGASIPDEQYHPRCEGLGAEAALRRLHIPLSFEYGTGDWEVAWEWEELRLLQGCHDTAAKFHRQDYQGTVEANLRRFAVTHHLSIPEGGS